MAGFLSARRFKQLNTARTIHLTEFRMVSIDATKTPAYRARTESGTDASRARGKRLAGQMFEHQRTVHTEVFRDPTWRAPAGHQAAPGEARIPMSVAPDRERFEGWAVGLQSIGAAGQILGSRLLELRETTSLTPNTKRPIAPFTLVIEMSDVTGLTPSDWGRLIAPLFPTAPSQSHLVAVFGEIATPYSPTEWGSTGVKRTGV
jgi:hypothetical protein